VRVVIGTGGTAGHVFPALATAERLRDRFGADVRFVGRTGGQEARLVPAAGFAMATVEARPFRRALSPATLALPFAVLGAARRCREIVRGADAVLGMGGYVSVPVSLAARWERVPLVLHEQNSVPGLANRLAARWAAAVAVSFPDARARFPRRSRPVVTGNPVRDGVLRVREDRRALREDAHRELGLEPGRRTVFVFGGSQGALRLNRAAVEAGRRLIDRGDLQLLLLTGPAHHDGVRADLPSGGELLVRTAAFLERMELAYAAADLVVSRAGATTVAEIAACGLPSILVPYPHATGRHQEHNARALQRAGAASLLLDDEATGGLLAERIVALVDHRERLEAMARAASGFGHPDAADALADLVAAAAKQR
jgi:UDP-N-acetylglucosamine--N-acetylmuramyl-(pentapeptide) pyrophosphoryl-undecaprenol N-acetylglucosamine transferase